MKKLLVGLLALGSISAYSQVYSARDIIESLKLVAKAHTESPEVQDIRKEIENKYGVLCEGKSNPAYPQLKLKKVAKFKARCTGESQLFHLTVKSSFSLKNGETPNFKVIEYNVRF